jgi:hypothetical protein
MYFNVHFTSVNGNIDVIKVNNKGVIAVEKGDVFIHTSNIEIIHVINLEEFEKTIFNLNDLIKRENYFINHKSIIENKIKIMNNTLTNIGLRSKRAIVLPVLALGTVVGGLLTNSLNNLKEKDEDEWKTRVYKALIEINKQKQINEITIDHINNHTSTLKKSAKQSTKKTTKKY